MYEGFGMKLCEYVLIFLYDILIYNKIWEEYLTHCDIVLTFLAQKPLYDKKSKSEFGMIEIMYLVHMIGKDDVKVHMKTILVTLD